MTQALHLQGNQHLILLFHGLSSTPLELQFLARGLNRAGHSVRVAVIKGFTHGLPAEKKHDYRDWVADALEEFDRVHKMYNSVTVGGLCMGADLALCVAGLRAEKVAGVMALSTTLHFDGWANPWSRCLLPLAPYLPYTGRIGIRETEPFGLKDERLRKFIATQMKNKGASDAGAAMLRVSDLVEAKRLANVTKKNLKKIVTPTLVIHARHDDVATLRSAYDVVHGVQSPRIHCLVLENSYHMVSIDQEKRCVLDAMKSFLGTNIAQTVEAPKGTKEYLLKVIPSSLPSANQRALH